ncbi:MAG: zinc ribbon domain-containing protein [Acidobacteriota bacterium]|nr:zinc ribbon domain-containing protein [Acidobacteriota bacterium]
MFCPHCGTESSQELNYCKRCGGNLYPPAPRPEGRPAVTPAAAWAVGLSTLGVVVVGLIALFAALDKLSERGLPPDVFKVLIVFVSLTIVFSVALLTLFWSRLLHGAARRPDSAPPQLASPTHANELGAAQFTPLASARQPSVTEQTTRTLERS